MKSSAILTLLFASVSMNLFTLAGYVRARSDAPAQDPAALVTTELGLNQQQADRFRTLRTEMDATVEYCRGNQALLSQEMIDEIRSDSPNVDRIMELMDQSADLERRLRADAAARFGTFVSGLEPEQREAMLRAMHHDRPGRGGDRRLSRFDKNKDGRLDEAERAEASAYYENRDRGRRGGRGGPSGRGGPDDGRWQQDRDGYLRRQLQRRFDANDDKNLDDAEVEAFLKWLRPAADAPAA